MAQHYGNHKRFFPPYHFFTIPLVLICIGLAIYAFVSIPSLITGLIVVAFALIGVVALFARMFALKAQDRAARAEEKLRYYMLSGKALPATLRMGQILSLRFAADEEYLALVDRTVSANLSPDEIKKAIKNWRGDYHRI